MDKLRASLRAVILLVVVASITTVVNAYTLDGDTLLQEDNVSKVTMWPHTCYSPVGQCRQYTNLTSKAGSSQTVKYAFLFNSTLKDAKLYEITTTNTSVPNYTISCSGTLPNGLANCTATLNGTIPQVQETIIDRTSAVTQTTYNGSKAYYGTFTMGAGQTRRFMWDYTVDNADSSKKYDLYLWVGNMSNPTWSMKVDPWWNNTFASELPITITNNNATTAIKVNYTLTAIINHQSLVSANTCLNANGDDLRIVYNDSIELDRINLTSWNSTNTVIAFRAYDAVGAGATDSANYSIYCGNSQAANPPTTITKIYLPCSSDFEGGSVPAEWDNVIGTVTRSVSGGRLHISSALWLENRIHCSTTYGQDIGMSGVFNRNSGVNIFAAVIHAAPDTVALSEAFLPLYDRVTNFTGAAENNLCDNPDGTVNSGTDYTFTINSTVNGAFNGIAAVSSAGGGTCTGREGDTSTGRLGLTTHADTYDIDDIRVYYTLDPDPTVSVGSGHGNSLIDASTYNVTSATGNGTVWRVNTSFSVNTTTPTPTIVFNTTQVGNCSIGKSDLNYSQMTANDSSTKCGTVNTTTMSCTLPNTQALVSGAQNIYLSCVWAGEHVYNTSDSGPLNITLLTTESAVRSSIVTAMTNVLGNPTIYTDQQIYLRRLNGTQQLATFDKVAVFGNQRWAVNYLTGNDTYTNMGNLTPVLYVYETTNISTSQLQTEVEALIRSTRN